MTDLVSIQSLNLQLGRRRILQHINLSVGKGEFIGLLGPNGAGKSSLLKCIAGLQMPTAGNIQLNGHDLHEHSRTERARKLAYLEQDADCHWPMAVEDVVALGRLPYRLASRSGWSGLDVTCRQQIEAAIEESGLESLRSRQVNNLSGGERRRVMLARTLATQAHILLADEPVAGLDPAHQLRLMELLATKASGGTSIIVVLHDLALAARYCQRIIMLNEGAVAADGCPKEVISRKLLAETYGIDAHITLVGGLPVIIPLTERHAPG